MDESSICGDWAPDPVHSDHDVQNGPNLLPKQPIDKTITDDHNLL